MLVTSFVAHRLIGAIKSRFEKGYDNDDFGIE